MKTPHWLHMIRYNALDEASAPNRNHYETIELVHSRQMAKASSKRNQEGLYLIILTIVKGTEI